MKELHKSRKALEAEPAQMAAPNFNSTTSSPSSGKTKERNDGLSEETFFNFSVEQEWR